ncbi:protein phosphatase 2C domain-containing protein [Streptomyces sp. WAC 00631]|uniref:protein phosphatase 2C domain-containing protein n=1 Tax=Streptomyces sp. WAC 00631 TaxID=2203201 RepID=UPI000F79B3CD|nr:protein phosphatase 2C domain-containing protein [Streptomyces sp. WAC 00631]MCC5032285.1 protein phosphatase 2C domain-containing protein [Streptomyces sp. WAC 00631]
MRVSIATQPGSPQPNEDWVAATPTLAVVLDGLSTAGLETGCKHGVPWYVAHLGGHLIATLADPTRSLPEGLALALENVAALHPECDLSNPGTPSATVAILREHPDAFGYLVLADSPIVFEGEEGHRVVTDLSVDRVVSDLRAETEKYPTGSPEHAASVRRMVTAQRQLRNVHGGYWVAAADPQAAEHTVTGVVPRGDVRAAAVMSDGVSRLVNEYGMATWEDVFRTLRVDGTQTLIKSIRKVEATDPDGRRWPRFKTGDDAAVAFCLP